MTRHEAAVKLGVIALAVAVRLAMLSYFVSRQVDIVSDSIEYVNIARGWRIDEPFLLGYLIARPPLFPLLIAGIQSLFGEAPIYVALANVILSSLICLVGYDLARQLSSRNDKSRWEMASTGPVITGLILALDPTSVALSATLAAEPLANLFFGLSLLSIVRVVQERQPVEALWAGLWLALSALTRPTGLFFFVIAVVVFYLLLPRSTWWRYYALFAFLPLVAGLGWSYRNYRTAGVFTFASVADFNMLFYRAAAVERWATGQDVDVIRQEYAWRVEQKLGSGVTREQIDSGYFWINFAPQDPRRLSAMRDIALSVYLEYPFWYVATIPIGLYNMLASVLMPPFPIWLEIGLNVVFYLLAARGLWLAWRSGRRDIAILSLTTILYFVAATLASQTTGMSTRMRSPFTIWLAVLAAQAAVSLAWRQPPRTVTDARR